LGQAEAFIARLDDLPIVGMFQGGETNGRWESVGNPSPASVEVFTEGHSICSRVASDFSRMGMSVSIVYLRIVAIGGAPSAGVFSYQHCRNGSGLFRSSLPLVSLFLF
jgi:hypothetical protein